MTTITCNTMMGLQDCVKELNHKTLDVRRGGEQTFNSVKKEISETVDPEWFKHPSDVALVPPVIVSYKIDSFALVCQLVSTLLYEG